MATDWRKGIKEVFEKGKEKLDEGYEKIKEADENRASTFGDFLVTGSNLSFG